MVRKIAGAAAVVLAVVAAGCSKSATGVSVPVTGEWMGATNAAAADIGFDMTLTEDSTEHISGTGLMTGWNGMGGSITCTVSGARSGSDVTLTLNTNGFVPATYTGQLADDNTMEGHLNNSGFNNVPLTLRR